MIQLAIMKTAVPIKAWTPFVENTALEQAIFIADHMPVHSHLALMPDVHAGKGMPIGGVAVLENAVCPNMVGVDIGCGMSFLKLKNQNIHIQDLRKIFQLIREYIPVGINRREEPVFWNGFSNAPDLEAVKNNLDVAEISLGTLGGGNHFIELQKGNDGYLGWMVHSGSRKFGLEIANHYHKLAVVHGIIPNGNKNLAYFRGDSQLGQEYIAAMNFALDYAYENRMLMMYYIKKAMGKFLYFDCSEEVNIHHNYAEEYESGLWVHRKGATDASGSQLGIIPGSQGSHSYIVRGKGNKESFKSCSHGAGRTMSRSKAKKTLNRQECLDNMEKLGLDSDVKTFSVDEDVNAYKDIKTVMDNQSDLVDIVTELFPYKLRAIKG